MTELIIKDNLQNFFLVHQIKGLQRSAPLAYTFVVKSLTEFAEKDKMLKKRRYYADYKSYVSKYS